MTIRAGGGQAATCDAVVGGAAGGAAVGAGGDDRGTPATVVRKAGVDVDVERPGENPGRFS